MDILNSIVCGIDASKASTHACQTVMEQMAKDDTLLAVAVLPQEPMAYDATADVLARLDQEIAHQRVRLTEALARVEEMAKAKGLKVSTSLVTEGRPYEQILQAAEKAGAGLVVMGVGHRGALQRRLVGSTVSRVVGFGALDALLVPEGAHFGKGPLLAPTDGSAHGGSAVALADRLAQSWGRELAVLSVAEAPKLAADEPMSSLGADILAEQAHTVAEQAASGLRKAERQVQVVVRTGEPYAQISKTATELDAGFIVMGSHGRTGISRLLMGSTTERVLETAPCPVLITRA